MRPGADGRPARTRDAFQRSYIVKALLRTINTYFVSSDVCFVSADLCHCDRSATKVTEPDACHVADGYSTEVLRGVFLKLRMGRQELLAATFFIPARPGDHFVVRWKLARGPASR
jgi:hypothetical protein